MIFLLGALVLTFLVIILLWPTNKQSERFWWIRAAPIRTMLASAPIVGILLCQLISFFFHFEDTTKTHCGVYNFIPSVSSSIGNNTPQLYIWRVAVAIHNFPLVLDAMYLHFALSRHLSTSDSRGARFAAYFKVVSHASLFLLSYVSSTENFEAHEAGFIWWALSGGTSIIAFTTMWFRGVANRPKTPREQQVARYLLSCIAVFVLAGLACAFLYWLHNAKCYPYVYSLFSLCEITVIGAYIAGCGFGHHVAFTGPNARIAHIDADFPK